MADKVVGNLAIRLDFDGAKFEQGITKAKRELSTYSKATQASTRIAKADNFERGKSTLALSNMQVQYKGLQGTLQSHADMNQKLIEQGKENSGAFEKNENAMRNYEVQMWELNEQYKQFQKEMYTANSGFTKMGDAMTKVGGTMQTFGAGITEIGTGITKLGAMASASLGLVAKVAIEFEEGMVQVQKTTNASAEEMAVFEEQIRGLALAMPLAVGELANVAALAGQLGVAQEDIAGFTETMAMLGTATNLSAEEAGNALARFQNVTGSSVDTVENLGSAIVHLGNNVAATESEIIHLAQMLAGSMITVGASEIDILGLSAAMSALGITAERGGSSMSKFFVDLASYVSTGAKELDTFAKVAGMSKKEFSELFTQDSMAAVEAFIIGLGGIGEEGGNMLGVLDKLGIKEVRLRDTILRLANGHDVLSESLDLSKEGFEENIALSQEYELLAGTTASQIQIAKNQLHDLAITAGQELLPAIMDLLNNSDGIIDMLKGAVDWFVSLDDEMKQNLVKWSAMALVIGPVVSGLGNVVSGLGGLVTIGGSALTAIGRLDGALQAKAAGGLVDATVASQGLAGSKGLGGIVAAITGGTGLLWAIGLAGVAFAGWTWWDKWGRDAHESGERTKRWGVDVGEATDNTLTNIERLASGTSGHFGLMTQGLTTSTSQMSADFETLGLTVEQSLVQRIARLDELIAGLPESVRATLTELLEEDKKLMEENLAIVEENNARMAEIRERAAQNERELTVLEAKQLLDLNRDSAEAYVNTLKISQGERQEILSAMNGDVENATKEQAVAWAISLAEQRQEMKVHHKEQKETYLEALRLEGYSEEAIAEHALIWDEANSAMSLGLEQQLAIIAEKYPEIMDEIILENGQMAHETIAGSDLVREANEKVIESAVEMSASIEATAIRNADNLKWMGDQATEAGRFWNDLILDEHGMLVKSNAREAVIEAAADIDDWNRNIRPQLKNADLDSNAKLIIGEAAIANGLWEGMAYEDKQAVLEDNFSPTLYEALEGTDIWNKLIAEKKYAVLGNEFGQTITEALMDFGTWDVLDPLIQEAILTTNTPETLQKVLEDIGMWEGLDPTIQDLIANSQPVEDETKKAKRMLDEYGNIIVNPPKMSVKDNVTSEVTRLQRHINQLKGKIVYIDAIARTGGSASSKKFIESGGSFLGAERGLNYHKGGLAMVNDQMGSLYRELVTLPDGQSFIPKGRNVVLDLPEGSKVLRAALTKMKVPKYRDGVGYSRQQTERIFSGSNTDMSQTNHLLSSLIQLIGQGQVIHLDGDQVGKTMYPRIDNTMSSNIQRNQIMSMGG